VQVWILIKNTAVWTFIVHTVVLYLKRKMTMRLIRRLNGYSVFLIIIAVTITVSLLYFMMGIEKQMLLEKIGQGDYNKGAVHFTFNREQISFKTLVNCFNDLNKKDFALIYDDYSSNIRQIFIKGDYAAPPLITGRFFNENDFNNQNKLAVIGKKYISNIEEVNGKEYIKISNERFRVIGIMGIEIDTNLDDRIIINADALYQELQNKVCILDSNSSIWKNRSLEIFNEFEQANKNIVLESLDIETVGIDYVIKKNINMFFLGGIMLLSYLWCSLTVAMDWIYDRNKKLSIMSLIGCSDIQLIKYIYKQYIFLVSIGFFLGAVIARLLNIYVIHFEYIVMAFLIIYFVSGLSIFAAIKKSFNTVLAERIR